MRRYRAFAVAATATLAIECVLAIGPLLPRSYPLPLPISLIDCVVGLVFVVAGLIGARTNRSRVIGVLMVLVGVGSFAPDLLFINWWPAYATGLLVGSLYVVVLGHLFLVFPSGRFESLFDRILISTIYLSVPAAGIVFITLLPTQWVLCADCPHPYGLSHSAEVGTALVRAFQAFWASALVVLLARLGGRWLKASPALRHVIEPVAATALPVFALLLTQLGITLLDPMHSGQKWLGLPATVAIAIFYLTKASYGLLPVGFLLGILRTRLDRSAVSDLAIQLGSAPTHEGIEIALGNVLHDPTIRVLYWVPSLRDHRDGGGHAVQPKATNGRRLERIASSTGEELATVVLDASADLDEELVAASLMVARLALENARLHAEVKAQLIEVRASRKRLLEAGDAERRRIERNLHDGAQQRLVTLALSLQIARDEATGRDDPVMARVLADSGDELKRALGELRELARGIHPALLTEAGLVPALRSLAERSPISATVVAASDLPALSESTAATLYYVASESMANAIKYSLANNLSVAVRRKARDRVYVEVSDDGIGGARVCPGSGLSGLLDRVAAAGGTLRIASEPSRGTTVSAEVPCD